MRETDSLKLSGWLLIVFAVTSSFCFHYLLSKIDYPDSLLGQDEDVVMLLGTIDLQTRLLWILYSVLPFLMVPIGFLFIRVFRPTAERISHAFKYITVTAACCTSIALLRWPTVHSALSSSYRKYLDSGLTLENSIYGKLNFYLGQIIGQIVGEVMFGVFLVFISVSMYAYKKWACISGIFISVFVLIGAFRGLSDGFDFAKIFYDNVGAIWLVLLGLGIIRAGDSAQKQFRGNTV